MAIKVMCPICNKRIFDIKNRASGEIEIKCPHCRNVISVELNSSRSVPILSSDLKRSERYSG